MHAVMLIMFILSNAEFSNVADAIHADGLNLRGRHEITDALSTRLLNGIYKGNSLLGYVIDFSNTVAKQKL
jgi:hypothetical protein